MRRPRMGFWLVHMVGWELDAPFHVLMEFEIHRDHGLTLDLSTGSFYTCTHYPLVRSEIPEQFREMELSS